jgi:GDPmannose 4,6-dehydratase
VQAVPQKEDTPFYPRSPYAVAKMYAYWITVNYREAYGIYACNGILFNHESPRRGETFVSRKITMAVSNIIFGNQDKLYLGNIDAKRDWGHAKDYVELMWMMLQEEEAEDYVIATGVTTKVRDFVSQSFAYVGIELAFSGSEVDEKGTIKSIDLDKLTSIVGAEKAKALKVGDELMAIDPYYFRPTEVDLLLGDATKAKEKLGWTPKYDLAGLIKDMMDSDLAMVKNA